jgi:hypothetical protein
MADGLIESITNIMVHLGCKKKEEEEEYEEYNDDFDPDIDNEEEQMSKEEKLMRQGIILKAGKTSRSIFLLNMFGCKILQSVFLFLKDSNMKAVLIQQIQKKMLKSNMLNTHNKSIITTTIITIISPSILNLKLIL